MHTVKIIDLEAKVLDKEEKEKAVGILLEEVKKRIPEMRKIIIDSARGPCPGDIFFNLAQGFEYDINGLSLEDNIRITPAFVEGVQKIFDTDQEFFEYPYLMGKILLFGLMNQERHVIKTKSPIVIVPGREELKQSIEETHNQIEKYFQQSLDLFDAYLTKNPKELMKFYKRNILSNLAKLYRRKAFFAIRSKVELSDVLSFENSLGVLKDITRSIELYKKIFQEEIFIDEESVYREIASFANAMKPIKSIEYVKRGLAYYQAAKKFLGNLPEIEEGIEFYTETLNSLSNKLDNFSLN